MSLSGRAAAAFALFLYLTGSPSLPVGAYAPTAKAGDASIVREVLNLVERRYVEPGRVEPAAFVRAALSSLEKKYPEVIVDLRGGGLEAAIRIDGQEKSFHLEGLESLSSAAPLLEEALDYAAPRLAGVEEDEVRYTALRGGLQILDPHTQIFDHRQIGDFQTRTSGSFGGVGFRFTLSGEGILVVDIIPGTPAEKVGLKTGDVIVAVDTLPAAGLTTGEAVGLVRGEPGTEVVLTVTRDGWREPQDLTPVRAVIRSRSVRSEVFTAEGEPSVGYIRVDRFQSETALQIREALEKAGEGVAGIILDLRGNPGGLLDQAVASTDIFLDSGVIVSIRGGSGRPEVHRADMFGIVQRQLPLVVLISRTSASASEVMAAALKESRALVIGEASFGKGSVQQLYTLSDGGGLLLTIRHYFTPGEVSIQSRGVRPDVLLSPVVVGERIILGEPAVHRREGSLENAFARRGKGPEGEGSPFRIEYLRESMPGLLKKGGGGPEAGRSHDLREEVAVRAAAAILRRAAAEGRGTSRAGLLDVTGPALEGIAAGETSRIREVLETRGIAWEEAPAAGAEVVLEAELPAEIVLEPGESARVTVRVRNIGRGTAHRVWGRSSSDNPLLSNIDFVFGTVPPGGSREATVDLPVPSWARQRWDTWNLAMREGDGAAAGTFGGVGRTVAGTQPSVAYSVRLSDGDGADPSRGGDGVLEGSERLTIGIRAAGEGRRLDLRVSPRPVGKVSLGKREAVLRPAESDEGRASFDARLVDAEGLDSLELDLAFRSGAFGLVLEDRISVPVGSPYRVMEERMPPLVRLLQPLPEKTGSARITLLLDVTDEEGVRDVYILAGGKKIFYRRSVEPGSRSLPVELEVALAGGSNRIVVFARDNDGLVTERTFFVYRLSG